MSTIDTKLLEERNFADQQASYLDLATANRWQNCRSAHRFMAFRNKQVVAYRLMFGQPQIITTLTCKSLSVDLHKGMSSVWSDLNSNEVTLSHIPTEIAPSCFMWHTKRSSLDFMEYQLEHSMKFSMAYRTERNPATTEDGKIYLLERAVFDHFDWQKS